MRHAFRILAIAILVSVSACDDHRALPPPAIEPATTSEEAEPCEAAIDAIGWRCADGHTFSARHDLNDACAVVFEGEHVYSLPRAGEGYSNGTVTLTQHGDQASLTGTDAGPHENCASVRADE